MDNSDVIQIVGKIGEVHTDLKNDISALRSEFSEFKGGAEVRIATLEEDLKTTRQRQWIHSTAIVPTLAVLHGVARYLGIRV